MISPFSCLISIFNTGLAACRITQASWLSNFLLMAIEIALSIAILTLVEIVNDGAMLTPFMQSGNFVPFQILIFPERAFCIPLLCFSDSRVTSTICCATFNFWLRCLTYPTFHHSYFNIIRHNKTILDNVFRFKLV